MASPVKLFCFQPQVGAPGVHQWGRFRFHAEFLCKLQSQCNAFHHLSPSGLSHAEIPDLSHFCISAALLPELP